MKPNIYRIQQQAVPAFLKLLLSVNQPAAELYPLFPGGAERTVKN